MAGEKCVFCRIVSGKEKAWVVGRDKFVMAVLDPYPLTKGHTLIIPIQHYESMFDIPEELLVRITKLSRRLCRSYERTLAIQGVSIEVMNHRQKNPRLRHFHLHVIPRYAKNDRRDPANVKPSQVFPRESDARLTRILFEMKADKDLGICYDLASALWSSPIPVEGVVNPVTGLGRRAIPSLCLCRIHERCQVPCAPSHVRRHDGSPAGEFGLC